MDIASETGIPLMRPMFFDFPDDERCYTLEDQYMFGPDILFAPITACGCRERTVYLPEGNWIRTSDGETHAGGRAIRCAAELADFIAFVREGCDVIGAFRTP